jgi:hypothetical protein
MVSTGHMMLREVRDENVASRNSTSQISRILVTINVALGAFSWSRRGHERLRSGQCFRRYHRHAYYWCKSAEHNDYVREHFYGRTQLHSNISVEFVDNGPFKPHFSLELLQTLLGYSGPVLRSLSTQLLRTVFPLLKLDTSEIPLILPLSLRAP